MPQRSRNNNTRKHASAPIGHRNNHDERNNLNDPEPEQRRRHQHNPLPFSPPTQLPTPLPEERHPVPSALDLLNFGPSSADADDGTTTAAVPPSLALSSLIDFDAHTRPPHIRPSSPAQGMEASFTLSEDDIDDGDDTRQMLLSPPYREARLLTEEDQSPPPLPVPARYGQRYVGDLDLEDVPTTTRVHGLGTALAGPGRMQTHGVGSRSPASPSRHSSSTSQHQTTAHPHLLLPRTTVSPSAPRVSKPLSYASFSGSPTASQVAVPVYSNSNSQGGRVQQEFEREYEREEDIGAGAGVGYYDGYGYPRSPPPPHPAALTRVDRHTQGHGYHQPQPQQYQHQRQYSQPDTYNHQYQHNQHQPTLAHPQPHPASTRSPSSGLGQGFMGIGSGLAQAIKRGAAGARGVVGGGAQGGSGITRGAGRGRGEGKGRGVGGGLEEREEGVVWARWDWMGSRRVLLIAYPAALQMWDCADLSAVRELFHIDLSTPEWGLMLGGEDSSGSAGRGSVGLGGNGKKGTERVRIVHAAVLPERKSEQAKETDALKDERPLLGMLLESTDEDERVYEPRSVFVVYSLRTHQVVKMRAFTGLGSTFTANEYFIVIGTISPPNVHILSSTTFHTLHIISSAHLELYSTPQTTAQTTTASAISITNAITNTAQSTSVSLGLAIDTNRTNNSNNSTSSSSVNNASAEENNNINNNTAPHPVFALSHRLLAYASPSPAYSPLLLATTTSSASNNSTTNRRLSSSPSAANTPSSLSSSPFGGIGKIANMTQADMGHAAMKVGESMFSGMKFIGSMALEAAKNRVAGTGGGGGGVVGPEGRVSAYGRAVDGVSRSPGGNAGVGIGMGRGAVSRSAPNDTSGMSEEALRERRYSNMSTLSNWEQQQQASSTTSGSPNPHLTTVAPSTRSTAESGHYVTVVDLGPLLGSGYSGGSGAVGTTPVPVKIDEFNVSRSQPVADITFAKDGTSVAAVLRDGHVVRVFKLQPTPRVLLAARSAASVGNIDDLEMRGGRRAATHVYNLYRGRTSAVVEGVEWARDGRWVAVGTRNRTIHVFGTNPYGGAADVRSHIDGRVRNIDVIEPSLITTHPLVRLRGAKANVEHANVPLAFTFISPSDVASAPNLVMPFAPPPVTNSPTFSSPQLKRGTNYQDILVFDPVDCSLSLRRLTIEKQAVKEQGISASINALGVTSISLPGMGGAGRLSSAPSNKGVATSGKLGMTKAAEERTMELGVTEGVQAAWDLRRKKNWVEIKMPIHSQSRANAMKAVITGGDWLAEGEISTCSKSARVLPRSLYLSHQFSFQTLGEDYHALIRRYQLDISGTAIEVRRAVEISAYSSGGGESSFVEGFSSPRDIRRVSSSFDEPIASAISGSFDSSNLPTILPMYPNGGAPGSKPKPFRSSIPIRTMTGIGDGVSEGLGRLRREMHKARSPQLVPRSDSSLAGSVPLEFDEEDEDFLSRDALEVPVYAHGGDRSTSRDASRDRTSGESAPSLTTPPDLSTHQLMDADVLGAMEEDLFDGWDNQDKLAVEEAERFHDVTDLASVEDVEERLQQVMVPPAGPEVSTTSKRKGRAKRRG